jgi:sulfotransferase family protein
MSEPSSHPITPFFIIGAQRSGTTMLRLMLNSHPKLAVPFESGFIPQYYLKHVEYGDLKIKENAEKLLEAISENSFVKRGKLIQNPHAILSNPIASYRDLVNAIFLEYAKRNGKERWGDKTPSYATELDILWHMFPGCRFVHLIRDGRDVAVSLGRLEWGSGHIPTVAEDWRWITTLAHKIGSVLGEHYLEVRYEDLVLYTEETLRSICAFLKEPFHEDMLTFHVTAEREMPSESMKWHQTSVQAPDESKVFMWKQRMSLSDRIIFEQIAGSTLDLFGYERERHTSTWGSRLKKLYYCTFKR